MIFNIRKQVLQQEQCRRAGCAPTPLLLRTFFKMPECRTVRHLVSPVPEWKRVPMPEPVRNLNKKTQSVTGILRCQTDMSVIGMPMAVASALIPMPYASMVRCRASTNKHPKYRGLVYLFLPIILQMFVTIYRINMNPSLPRTKLQIS
jgi:hypothetical protein